MESFVCYRKGEEKMWVAVGKWSDMTMGKWSDMTKHMRESTSDGIFLLFYEKIRQDYLQNLHKVRNHSCWMGKVAN